MGKGGDTAMLVELDLSLTRVTLKFAKAVFLLPPLVPEVSSWQGEEVSNLMKALLFDYTRYAPYSCPSV